MPARPATTIGSFLFLAVALLLSIIPAPQSHFWIAEIEGASMSLTLQGERIAFRCPTCQQKLLFDSETASQRQVLHCETCNTLQLLPENLENIPPDRVILRPIGKSETVRLGAIVAIEHPLFGQVVKRVSSLTQGGYLVTGDNPLESIDSRNPRFGIVSHNQICGIVVRILPTRPLAEAKRSR